MSHDENIYYVLMLMCSCVDKSGMAKMNELSYLGALSTSSLDSIEAQLHDMDLFAISRDTHAGTLDVNSRDGKDKVLMAIQKGDKWLTWSRKGLITIQTYPLTSIDSLLY